MNIIVLAATLYTLSLWGYDPRGMSGPWKRDACQWLKRAEKRAGVDAKCFPIGPEEDAPQPERHR